MTNVTSFYAKGIFGTNSPPTNIDLSQGTYKKYCVWKNRDHGIKYTKKQTEDTLRSKNIWNTPTDGLNGACVSPGSGYTKVGEFYFEDATTPPRYE